MCTVCAESKLNPMTGVMIRCKRFGQLIITGKALYKKQLLLLLSIIKKETSRNETNTDSFQYE